MPRNSLASTRTGSSQAASITIFHPRAAVTVMAGSALIYSTRAVNIFKAKKAKTENGI
jgi:hypothetical protein